MNSLFSLPLIFFFGVYAFAYVYVYECVERSEIMIFCGNSTYWMENIQTAANMTD